MTEFYAFAAGNPWLTFFLCWIAGWVVTVIAQQPFRIFNRWMRSRNIAARGWPPEYLDADGDFKPEPKKDEDAA